ncbi:hypothetical protein, partial [Tepidiforma sp.]|uniref:hypothetical protein n=1 Tax=Tepidiforma sp. TaxID=2682230 RepID=UPI003A10383E
MRRFPVVFAGALTALALAGVARADGEAGLVIQDGETVTTYCVPFQGDSISGEQLLASAGLPIEKFGGGSGVVVCAIGATGCFDPSSFDSCFCQCKGNDCTYWAFFTRQYGKNWVYSSLGVALARARDGELHAWKWGKGGPSSAPAPSNDITFEQVCGHPPRGGAPAPTPTFTPSLPSPASTLQPTPASTLPPSPAITLQP